MSLNRNDIKVELYRLIDLGEITGGEASKIFAKSYENQQLNQDIMVGVDESAADWVQQTRLELGF